jgi:Polysaccharide biosynthesis protein
MLQSLLIGLQLSYVVARLALLFNVLGAVGVIISLSLGMGINGLAISWLTVTVLTIGANWAIAKRHFPALQIDPRLFSWRELRRIMRFSTKVQVATLTLFLNDQVDRTLIVYALGPASLGFYQLASRAAFALRGISFSLLPGFVAVSSDLAATSQHARLQRLYIKATRYVAAVDYGLFAGVASLSQPLVWAWLGAGYGQVADTIILVLAGYAVWLPTQPTTETLKWAGPARNEDAGRPGIPVPPHTAQHFPNMALRVLRHHRGNCVRAGSYSRLPLHCRTEAHRSVPGFTVPAEPPSSRHRGPARFCWGFGSGGSNSHFLGRVGDRRCPVWDNLPDLRLSVYLGQPG